MWEQQVANSRTILLTEWPSCSAVQLKSMQTCKFSDFAGMAKVRIKQQSVLNFNTCQPNPDRFQNVPDQVSYYRLQCHYNRLKTICMWDVKSRKSINNTTKKVIAECCGAVT